MELDVELCGKSFSKCGVLVVRDPPGGTCAQAPGVLGMNVLGRCYQGLFGQHGPALFDSTPVSGAPKPVFQALQHYHQVSIQFLSERMGNVKVRGPRARCECRDYRCFVVPSSGDRFLNQRVCC